MKPPMPIYNPATDGNRFNWILEQSKVVRQQRQEAAQHERFTLAEMEVLRKHDADIERDDEARLRNLRAQYNQSRNRGTRKVA